MVTPYMEPRLRSLRRLLDRIKRSPHNTRFGDLCKLIEAAGIPRKRQSGSHRVYEDEADGIFFNLQSAPGGKAKGYQVRQVVRTIEDLVLARLENEED